MIPDKLFINLKILSKIQKNGRISRSSDGIIALENETFYQSLKRFITSDSRKQSVFEINSIINETIECLNNIINSKFMNKMYSNTDEYYKNCENMVLILRELNNAKIGIENLKFTYSSDANVSSQLDILVIKINSSLKDMNYKLAYFQTYLPENYKIELENHKAAPINYYVNDTNSGNITGSSPNYQLSNQYNTHIEQQFTENNFSQVHDNQFQNNKFDDLNNNIVDMNNIDSVL
jgi:hypothetical protein